MSKLNLEKLIYRAAGKKGELSHAEFRVLAVLMTYTDKDGRNAHPGAENLAADTGIDQSNIGKVLKRLETKGYVVKTEQGGHQHGRGRANVYRVEFPQRLIPKGVMATSSESDEEASQMTPGSDCTPKGVMATSKGVMATSEGGNGYPPSGPSSDPSSDPLVSRPVSRAELRSAHAKTPEASSLNPPIRNRAEVLEMIQAIAADPWQYGMDDLAGLLEEHHSQELADYLEYGWEVPRKATDRYEAGAWLNKLLHTAAREGVTMTPTVTRASEPRTSFLADDDEPHDEEAERNRQLAALRAAFPGAVA